MRRLNAWLRANSAILDFLSKVVIGGVALYVSYAAYGISQQQLKISENQLRLSEVNSEPDIYVTHSLERDDATGYAAHARMEVSNTGGQAHNVAIKFQSFIRVRRYLPSTTTLVPVTGYYFAQFSTGRPQGLLTTVIGHRSNEQFGVVYRELLTEDFKSRSGLVEARVSKRDQFLNGEKVRDGDIKDYLEMEKKAQALVCLLDVGRMTAAALMYNEEKLRLGERCL